MKRVFATGALALSLTVAGESRADERREPDRVVVLVVREGDPFGLRLEAELRSIGMRVVKKHRHDGVAPNETVAVATLFDKPHRRVEIRMGSHPSLLVDPDVVVAIDDVGGDVPSIQAAERVRAAFEPLAARAVASEPPIHVAPSEAPAPFAPPSIVARPPPASPIEAPDAVGPYVPPLRPIEERHWFGVGLGLGALVGAQGASLEITPSVFFVPVDWCRIEPFVMIPLLPVTFEQMEGRADLYVGGGGVRVAFTVVRSTFASLGLGGGIAGLWLRAEGDPNAGYVGSTEDGFTAAALVDLTPRIRVAGPFWIAPRATLGFALPPAKVVFDDVAAGTWGLPFADLNVSAEIEWSP